MQVAVVGGTGTLGAPLVTELIARGEEVRVLSRGTSAAPPAGATHRRVDLVSGEGLTEALKGADVVVDAANAQKQPGKVLVEGTKRLLEAGSEAGVRHHVAISIVGCDKVPLSYYKLKTEQEEIVASAPVPSSLLRATQFHPFLAGLFAAAAKTRLRITGAAQLQPIDVGVVARRLADAVQADPGGRLPDLAGPEVRELGELSHAWQCIDGRRLIPMRIPSFGKLGSALSGGALCNRGATTPGPSFEEWLHRG